MEGQSGCKGQVQSGSACWEMVAGKAHGICEGLINTILCHTASTGSIGAFGGREGVAAISNWQFTGYSFLATHTPPYTVLLYEPGSMFDV